MPSSSCVLRAQKAPRGHTKDTCELWHRPLPTSGGTQNRISRSLCSR